MKTLKYVSNWCNSVALDHIIQSLSSIFWYFLGIHVSFWLDLFYFLFLQMPDVSPLIVSSMLYILLFLFMSDVLILSYFIPWVQRIILFWLSLLLLLNFCSRLCTIQSSLHWVFLYSLLITSLPVSTMFTKCCLLLFMKMPQLESVLHLNMVRIWCEECCKIYLTTSHWGSPNHCSVDLRYNISIWH